MIRGVTETCRVMELAPAVETISRKRRSGMKQQACTAAPTKHVRPIAN